MKFNHFSIVETSVKEQRVELERIDFLSASFRKLVEKSFPESFTSSAKLSKIKSLQATKTQDLDEYLRENNEEVNGTVFYNVALQLLGFLEFVDFQIDQPFEMMKEKNIPHLENFEDIHEAWYLLLNTHTKFGLRFIDYLASKGYFKDFPKDQHLFFNGKSLPIFTSADFLREVVYVETDLDTDQDGKLDLVRVEIIRPNTQMKIPSLFTASPYYQGINPEANDRKLHEYKIKIEEKQPNNLQYEDIQYQAQEKIRPPKRLIAGVTMEAEESFTHEQTYFLNDFMLTRGFASVNAAGIGGSFSDGIMTCGSVEQTLAMKAVVEWLAGNRVAFTNKTNNIQIHAHWSNQKVAMSGKSYLGTLATAVATTGVEGLETIISEAAISNWYQYYRDNGLVIAPGGYPGEDADVLAELTFSRMIQAGDYLHIKDFFNQEQDKMTQLQDRTFGNYNTFWDERNYLPHIKNIKCDVIMVHGLNDWNVKPRHVEQLWQELRKVAVTKKIFLHQGEHIYIHNNYSLDFSDMMNLWLTHKLLGVKNQANDLLPNVLWQDNTISETWHRYEDWSTNEKTLTLFKEETGEKSFKDYLPKEVYEKYANAQGLFDSEILKLEQEDLASNRIILLTEELPEEVILNGVPKLTLNIKSSATKGILSARLVDYRAAKRLEVTPKVIKPQAIDSGFLTKREDLKEILLSSMETSEKMISIGHLNLQNRENSWKNEEVKADEYMSVTFELQPTHYRLPKGRKIGLVLYATDYDYTLQGNEEIEYVVDLDKLQLSLPIR
ncbi:MAG: Xaa-Pro dipeptidyl-peptidase [Streptococcaceae bacterium]|jgi:X-Pro dipeptidyl-peptidase|nr:Xaa-Pro dipeptidyl-peptidase [Streptococcaceae bacterium]